MVWQIFLVFFVFRFFVLINTSTRVLKENARNSVFSPLFSSLFRRDFQYVPYCLYSNLFSVFFIQSISNNSRKFVFASWHSIDKTLSRKLLA